MRWTTKLTTLGFAASVALLGSACDDNSSSKDDGIEKAAAIAKEIKASPDDAEAVLKKHDMTEDSFEALMFEIAEDPAKAEAFAAKVGS